MFRLHYIRDRLATYDPNLATPGEATRQAAVAVVLRETRPGETDVLFIKRSDKPGDPWSGQMAFPGGHLDQTDHTLAHAAVRETQEEIGLDLTAGKLIGQLDHQHAAPRGPRLNMIVAPYVFEIEGDPTFTPNYEVAEVVWAPVAELASNARHDTETYAMTGTPTIFNGYRLAGGHFVWGLTYRMLKGLFATIDPAWEGPQEVE